MIIKNKNVEKSFDNASQIYKISSNIQRDLSDDFQEHIDYLDRTTNQKWLSDDEYDEKFHDFAKQNHDYYFDKYQSSLEEYFDITFIKPEGLIY